MRVAQGWQNLKRKRLTSLAFTTLWHSYTTAFSRAVKFTCPALLQMTLPASSTLGEGRASLPSTLSILHPYQHTYVANNAIQSDVTFHDATWSRDEPVSCRHDTTHSSYFIHITMSRRDVDEAACKFLDDKRSRVFADNSVETVWNIFARPAGMGIGRSRQGGSVSRDAYR